MSDISTDDSTNAGPDAVDAPAAAPRARRRAASRPAGPPAAVAPADDAADAGAPVDAGAAAADRAAPADAAPVDAAALVAAAAPADDAEPAPRTPRKRSPRKRAAATIESDAPPAVLADPNAGEDAIAAPVAKRAARKRTPRATRSTDPTPDLQDASASDDVLDDPRAGSAIEPPLASAADAPAASDDQAATEEPAAAEVSRPDVPTPDESPADDAAATGPTVAEAPSVAPTVALLFQAPDPAAAQPRRRRRASAPAGPPVTHGPSSSNTDTDSSTDAVLDTGIDTDTDTDSDGVEAALAQTLDGAPVVASDPAEQSDDEQPVDGVPTDDAPDDARDDEPVDDAAGTGRKRRRRGGRGRRPRTDEDTAPADADAPDAEPVTADELAGEPDDDENAEDDDEAGSVSSRRRRRRRRRSGTGGDIEAEAPQDPPGTVTKVRAPRRTEDEVASVRGSTRLEAKKQRRRDGREAGRRKPVITESEFLARRESVQRAMVVRESNGRTQIAVLEDGVLVEHYVANETNASMIGNVYLGRVQNVLPSMEAAFVDIGKGRNAVLYAGEVNWDAAGMEGQPRRIETALKSGDTVLVQVTKDPMGHKGARLTSQVSLPGRYLVFVPNSTMTGISRKLPDVERSRLKRILKTVVPEKAGVIVRTAAEGASEDELLQDVERLMEQWAEIEAKAASTSGGSAPKLLYGEPDLTIRVVRDVFNEDFSSLVVSGEGAWGVVQPYLTHVAPDLADRVTRWTSDKDVFAEHRIDEQLLKAMDRKVWLPSGGSLVIDRTEAMTVVDVNTGKFTGSGGNLEETVTRNNLEAAEEVVRQLRLRDIGGIIVVDFIDMVLEGNRDLVLRRLLECLGRDRTKHQVAEVTSLGLVQMTRKRVGQGLLEVFSEPCEHCQGRGVLISTEPVERRANGSGTAVGGAGGSSGSGGSGSSSRRGRSRGGDDAYPPVAAELPPVRQPIPAAFVASLVHAAPAAAVETSQPLVADSPAGSEEVADAGPVTAPVEQATVTDMSGTDVEPDVQPSRPARRRRRASAPTGPPAPRS